MNLLRVENLAKSYGGVRAVDDVSFRLDAGRMLALIGPNGAGKSTCFNLINGQISADSGQVFLAGRNVLGAPPAALWRWGVGRTFQITATFGSMTTAENVQMALLSRDRRLFDLFGRARAYRRDRAMELLSEVGMAEQADRPCGALAYGDVKRVELAIALANDPKLLLMDEPTAGMAPQERLDLMRLAKRLVKERGIGALFTEHSMDVVFGFADAIVVLARGRVIAEGDVDAIRENPRVREVYFGPGLHVAKDVAKNVAREGV